MRYPESLRQRYKGILGYTGVIACIVGLLILSPLLLLPFCNNEIAIAWSFVLPGLLMLSAGWVLSRLFLPRKAFNLTYQEGSVIVVLSWTMAILAGAFPFLISLDLSLTQAVFESTSGWTTTGLSVVDVMTAPHLVLFYRSVLQFAGGAGFAIIMLSALAGPAGTALSAAEGREGRLVPNIKRSAKLVVSMYICYAAMGIMALRAVDMEWFDALNHSFTAVSTGGFSTRSQSIGYWNSPGVEAVIIVLMLLGSTNFLTSYMLLNRKFKLLLRNGELRLEFVLLLLSLTLVFFAVTKNLYSILHEALRATIFQVVSAMSTTGFSTVEYDENWCGLGWIVLIVLMLIGGGTGSTAGGLKQYRIYILYRGLLWEFKRLILPQKAVTDPDVWHGEQQGFISDEDLRHAGLFVFLYLAMFSFGGMIISAYGYSLKQALFEFASTLGTVGLSAGVTTADTPPGILWTQILGMLLGRLEFFTIIIGAIKLSQDLRSMAPNSTRF
ncbi:MAG: TrkH family potassium uptake protein [Deltaproteobacteria bacterium]|nr:TrkH family potassium uptake protein [Deltaproteobacteria bacterium]